MLGIISGGIAPGIIVALIVGGVLACLGAICIACVTVACGLCASRVLSLLAISGRSISTVIRDPTIITKSIFPIAQSIGSSGIIRAIQAAVGTVISVTGTAVATVIRATASVLRTT